MPRSNREPSRTVREFQPTCGDFTEDGNCRHLPGKIPAPANLGALLTSFEKPLHSQADSEKRLAGAGGLQQGLAQARAVQRLQRGKMPHSREHDLVRRCHSLRLVRHHDLGAEIVERLLHRIQVARAVIDDGDHRSPLVLGSMRPRRRSREHATRRARAKALNSASILWWLERP